MLQPKIVTVSGNERHQGNEAYYTLQGQHTSELSETRTACKGLKGCNPDGFPALRREVPVSLSPNQRPSPTTKENLVLRKEPNGTFVS